MSIRVDSDSWIAGAIVVGHRGGGILAVDIPEDGEHGAPPLRNDFVYPDDDDIEARWLITTPPVGVDTFYTYEDGSFILAGPDGAYSFEYVPYGDYVALDDPQEVTVEIGEVDDVEDGAGSSAASSSASGVGASVAAAIGLSTGFADVVGRSPIVASTEYSGGWLNPPTESDEDRKKRIKKRRIELGILPPEVREEAKELIVEASKPQVTKTEVKAKQKAFEALLKAELQDALKREIVALWLQEIERVRRRRRLLLSA